MANLLRVLVVEDSEDDAKLVLRELRKGGYDVRSERVQTAEAMREALDRGEWDLIVSDYKMPGFTGLDALRIAREAGVDAPFILVSGTIGEEVAVDTIRAGVSDYLLKDRLTRLVPAVERALKDAEERREKARVEHALRESEAQHKALFEGAAEGILVADVETERFVYANPAICRMLGYTEEEVTRLGLADIHPKEALPGVIAEFNAQARGEKTLAAAIPCLRKDGSAFYADVTTAPVVINGRKCNVGFFADITERRLAEESRRESADRYRDLVEATEDLVQSVRPDGSIAFVNRAWRETLGYSAKEAQGLSMFDIIHPESREHCMGIFQRVVAGERVEDIEAQFVAKDGRAVMVEGSASCRLVDGKPVATYGIFHDVTERREAERKLHETEEQLRQSQKLEAIGRLAGGIAHDFNNMLGAIIGYSDVILRDLRREDPLSRDIEQIKAAADRAAGLTRQLLAFSRKQVLEPRVINVNSNP